MIALISLMTGPKLNVWKEKTKMSCMKEDGLHKSMSVNC